MIFLEVDQVYKNCQILMKLDCLFIPLILSTTNIISYFNCCVEITYKLFFYSLV